MPKQQLQQAEPSLPKYLPLINNVGNRYAILTILWICFSLCTLWSEAPIMIVMNTSASDSFY